jgi:hypothetical protein
MARPSPVQYHATVMVTVFVVLAALAAWAFLHHRGVGPFEAVVASSRISAGGLQVELVVTNDGSKEARANCHISAVDRAGTPIASESFLTGPIAAGARATFEHTVRDMTIPPGTVKAACT